MGRFIIALLVLYFWGCFGSQLVVSNLTCKEVERKALLKFKASLVGDSDGLVSSWVGEDCCNWKGIGCKNSTGNVVFLNLRKSCRWGLYTSQSRASKIDYALTELQWLKHLDLSCHYFHGSQIPRFLGSMKQLQYLNLSQTHFVGEVPHQLGNLTQLRFLDLNNAYTYPIMMKADNLDWLSGLHHLQYLDLGGINLTRASSLMKVIHKLPSLRELRLSNCQLSADHFSPSFVNLTTLSNKLEILDLSVNSLEGSIPHFIANLSSIRFLDLSDNHFNDSIPSWLGKKKNLQYLNLGVNQLTHVVGGIWTIIGKLCHLKYIDLSYNQLETVMLESVVNISRCTTYEMEELNMGYNNYITGHLPGWLGEFRGLRRLHLGSNNFSGGIPMSLGMLSSLEFLDLSSNYLHGVINEAFLSNFSNLYHLDLGLNSLTLKLAPDWVPPFQLEFLGVASSKLNSSFPKWLQLQQKMMDLDLSSSELFGSIPEDIGDMMPSLTSLYMNNNSLSGPIPRSLCKLSSLLVLDLDRNRLSGSIPDCWGVSSSSMLRIINLSSNRLSGSIPKSLVKVTWLWLLRLNNNFLEGDIPSSWKNFTVLRILDLGENNLTGDISFWNHKNFPKLQILRLRDNQIGGIIPPHLCSLPHLQVLDLANNNITGAIPRCFGNFSAMISIGATEYWRLASVYEYLKGQQLKYTTTKIGFLLVNMDLSSNNLVGTIPIELTSLSGLIGLNLSNNHLNGSIPAKIGEMGALESLDLSRNHLSGTIPQSMSALTYLAYLNLSYNDLHGRIPTGKQLQVLNDPSIYNGNPNLYGDPLPKKFPGSSDIEKPPIGRVTPLEEGESRHEKMLFYLVIILGVATGFWGVIGILILIKRWRYVYFQIADTLAYWIYARTTVSMAWFKRKLI